MNGHLNDEQMTGLLLDESAEGAAHLAECALCSAEEQRLRAVLAGFGEAARGAAERPEAFWAWQRGAVAGRLAEKKAEPRRLVWAGAMAVLVLLASMMLRQPPPEPAVAQADPDHVLLVEVERSMRREVPAALAPATLLANEMSRAAEAKKDSPQRR